MPLVDDRFFGLFTHNIINPVLPPLILLQLVFEALFSEIYE
jgi:hypothetical protein